VTHVPWQRSFVCEDDPPAVPHDFTPRTVIGTGAGLQAFKSAKTNLSLEAGQSYVNEDLETGEEREFRGGTVGYSW